MSQTKKGWNASKAAKRASLATKEKLKIKAKEAREKKKKGMNGKI